MKITKIEIFGYGKWVDKTVHLGPELNVITGPNGSGKSTLMSFVLSILFGFPNLRRKGQRDYDINPDNHFGGRLFLKDTIYGDVVIERTRKNGKQLLYMTQADDKDKVPVSDFSDLLNGLSKQDYLNYFGFTEEDLMAFVWENEEDFSKSLMSLGVSGRKVLNEITPGLEQEAEQIFKGNGQRPILNQQLQALEASQSAIDRASQDQNNYFSLLNALDQDKARLTDLRAQQEQVKAKELQLELAKQQESSLREYQDLEAELAGFNFVDYDENLTKEWYQINNRLEELEADQASLQASDSEQVQSNAGPAVNTSASQQGMGWMDNHQADSDVMYAQAKAYRNHLQKNEDINEEVIKKRYEQNRLLHIMGAEEIGELPEELSDSERQQWQKQYKAIQNRRSLLGSQGQASISAQNELADLDAEEKDLRKEYQELRQQGSPGRSWVFIFGLVLGLVGLVLMLAYFLLDGAFFIASGIMALVLAVIFIGVGAWLTQSDKKAYRDDIKAYELDFIDIQQERDAIQHRQNDNHVEKEHLDDELDQFLEELENLMVERGGQDYIESLAWIEEDYVTQIKSLDQDIRDLELVLDADSFSSDQSHLWADYQETIGQSQSSDSSLYQQFENDYLAWREARSTRDYQDFANQERQNRSQHLANAIGELKQERQAILDQFSAKDAADLQAKLDQQMTMADKQQRFDILAHHLDLSLLPFLNQDQALNQQIDQAQASIASNQTEIQELLDRISQSQADLNHISSNDDLTRLVAEDDQTRSQARQAAVEWAARKIAVDIFEQATLGEGGDANKLVMGNAVRYVNDLTDGRFTKLTYREEGIHIYSEATGWLPVDQLSHGEKALLFIAMRFAFLNAQLGQVELPIFIDEAFAHLDDQHKENVYRFLADRSLDNQIILLSTDELFSGQLPHTNYQEI